MTRGCLWDYNVKHYALKPSMDDQVGSHNLRNQHGTDLALRPCGLALGVGPWLAPVRIRLSLENRV